MKATLPIAQQVTQWLQEQQEEAMAFLSCLARMESPSSDAPAQVRIQEWLALKFQELGCYTLRMPGMASGGYLYVRYQGMPKGSPYQLLLGHCDTVWPKGTLKRMPVRSEDATLRGPGVYDMKAGLTQMYFALKAFRELPLEGTVCPVVLINSDEEIGSRESTPAIARLARRANRVYVLEPPLGRDGRLKTRRKGLARFTLTVFGKAAHAGLDPQKGVNAIVEMAHLVQRLNALNDFNSGTTVNVGLIEGGISPNTVAPVSKVVVDVRAPTSAEAEKVTRAIRSLKPSSAAVRLEITGGFGRPPMEATPRNQMLWHQATKVGRAMGLQLRQAAAGGGSDANTASQYTATLDGLGTTGDGAHALHEHIQTQAFLERTALLTLLLSLKPLST